MPYSKKRSAHLLFFAFLFILISPDSILYPADNQGMTAVSGNIEAGKESGGDDKVEPRKLPRMESGNWEPLFEMGESIYPSVIITTATLKDDLWDDEDKSNHLGDSWGFMGIVVRGTAKDCPVTVEISGNGFIKPSTFTGTLADKDTVYCVYPDIKYDYERLLGVKQTVPEMLTFKVTIAGKAYPEKDVRVQVRPVNECVIDFMDSSGNEHDVSYFFAAYVNENHPFINQILKEAIALKMVENFSGYQGDAGDVKSEIEAIWETLQRRGLRYGTMPASADDDNPYIDTQYVRLLGESINYAQANCVDGSVLLASIFRKIGLNTSLVEVPEHMFVAVDLDGEGKETVYIETTALGDSTLDEAIEAGHEQYMEGKDRFNSQKDGDEEYNIIDIQLARIMGIMPIKDSSAN